MLRSAVLPLMAAAALVLAGCGEAQDGEEIGAGTESPGDSPDQDRDQDPGGGQEQVDPGEPSPEAFEQRAAEIADSWPASPGDDFGTGDPENLSPLQGGEDPKDPAATEFTVWVGHGACDADFGAWVEETDEVVIVAGWMVPDPVAEECTEQLLIDDAMVDLDAELGERAVVDAVTGEELFGNSP